jgi:hypothetical protein
MDHNVLLCDIFIDLHHKKEKKEKKVFSIYVRAKQINAIKVEHKNSAHLKPLPTVLL